MQQNTFFWTPLVYLKVTVPLSGPSPGAASAGEECVLSQERRLDINTTHRLCHKPSWLPFPLPQSPLIFPKNCFLSPRRPIGLSWWLSGTESIYNAGDAGLIPRSEDLLEKEMANHSSILAWEIPFVHRGAWWATVHGTTKSQMWVSN